MRNAKCKTACQQISQSSKSINFNLFSVNLFFVNTEIKITELPHAIKAIVHGKYRNNVPPCLWNEFEYSFSSLTEAFPRSSPVGSIIANINAKAKFSFFGIGSKQPGPSSGSVCFRLNVYSLHHMIFFKFLQCISSLTLQ